MDLDMFSKVENVRYNLVEKSHAGTMIFTRVKHPSDQVMSSYESYDLHLLDIDKGYKQI